MQMPEVLSPTKQFSPVIVNDSPSSTQKNLTGIPRQIKDSAADLYNFIQKWNEHHVSAIPVLINIRDLKYDAISNKAEGDDLFPHGLKEQCDKLEDIFNKMVDIVDGMQTIVKQYEALKKLQDMKGNSDPVFLTWQMSHYVEVSKDVFISYEKELEVKKFIKENIATSHDKDRIEFLRISWIYQSFIYDDIDFKILSLLKETGLK